MFIDGTALGSNSFEPWRTAPSAPGSWRIERRAASLELMRLVRFSTCRVIVCLVKMWRTCVRMVLTPRPVAEAISPTVLPCQQRRDPALHRHEAENRRYDTWIDARRTFRVRDQHQCRDRRRRSASLGVGKGPSESGGVSCLAAADELKTTPNSARRRSAAVCCRDEKPDPPEGATRLAARTCPRQVLRRRCNRIPLYGIRKLLKMHK